MSAKAEISWKRETKEGLKVQVYAQRVGREWKFYVREKRFDQWQLQGQPQLVDWLELLDGVRRRIGRGFLRPQEEVHVKKMILDRFPGTELG